MNKPFKLPFTDDEFLALVRRMELEPSLVRRHLEEDITRLVDLPSGWLTISLEYG